MTDTHNPMQDDVENQLIKYAKAFIKMDDAAMDAAKAQLLTIVSAARTTLLNELLKDTRVLKWPNGDDPELVEAVTVAQIKQRIATLQQQLNRKDSDG